MTKTIKKRGNLKIKKKTIVKIKKGGNLISRKKKINIKKERRKFNI